MDLAPVKTKIMKQIKCWQVNHEYKMVAVPSKSNEQSIIELLHGSPIFNRLTILYRIPDSFS